MTHQDPNEMIRELLPDWVRGELDSARSAEVRKALQGDPDLRAEADVVRSIFEARRAPPLDLEGSVIDAVGGRAYRAYPSWALRTAAILVVSLGAVAVWQQLSSGATVTLDAAITDWGAEDGIVAGGLVLDDLSDEDLAVLLEELDESAS